MFVVTKRKIFYTISTILVVLSIISLFVFGLNFGIDFKGGSILELNYPQNRPDMTTIQNIVAGQNLGEASVRPTGDKGYIIRVRNLTEPERAALVSKLGAGNQLEIKKI